MSKSDFLWITGLQWFTIGLIFLKDGDFIEALVATVIAGLGLIGSMLSKKTVNDTGG